MKILVVGGLGTSFSPFFSRRPFILDVQKARKDLNYSSTSFELWMRQTTRWFKEDYEGKPPENYIMREREREKWKRSESLIMLFIQYNRKETLWLI